MPATYHIRQVNEWVTEITFPETGRRVTLNVVAQPKPPEVPRMLTASLKAKKVGTRVDLRSKLPPVYDQGPLGSCVSNAVCAVLAGRRPVTYSRLFNYFVSRGLDAIRDRNPSYLVEDSGIYVVTGLEAATSYGLPKETLWPYNPPGFATLPAASVFMEAYKNRNFSYARVAPTLDALRSVLGQGDAVIFGIWVYESFLNTGPDGIVPVPIGSNLGGHCMVLVGYDDGKRRFTVRNSWGSGWGDRGHCYLSYEIVINPSYCFDFYRARAK